MIEYYSNYKNSKFLLEFAILFVELLDFLNYICLLYYIHYCCDLVYLFTVDCIFRTSQFDNFLLHLLTYFNCFFEKLQQEHKQNTSTYM